MFPFDMMLFRFLARTTEISVCFCYGFVVGFIAAVVWMLIL